MVARAKKKRTAKTRSEVKATDSAGRETEHVALDSETNDSVEVWHEPTPKEKFKMIGIILLIVAAIFAITAMEAPFYLVYERGPDDPIHPDDSHIGAPWRYFGISVLWYISIGASVVSLASLGYSRRL